MAVTGNSLIVDVVSIIAPVEGTLNLNGKVIRRVSSRIKDTKVRSKLSGSRVK